MIHVEICWPPTHPPCRFAPFHEPLAPQTCQQKLDAIKRDQAALRRGQYRSTTCPICLEDFEVAEGDASSSVSGSGGASTSTAAAGSSGAKGGGGGSGGGKDPEVRMRYWGARQ
jgi:hypothetical protein